MNTIPTLDIRNFYSEQASHKLAFVNDLKNAYEDIGFVIIKGHNVKAQLQQKSYEVVKDFFNLPTDVKMKYHVPNTGGARGYTPFRTEHAKDNPISDLKEFYHVGIEVPQENPLYTTYPQNLKMTAIVDFDSTLGNLYSQLLELGMDMLRAIALMLELDEEYFTEKVRYGNSILRPIHYPPLKGNEEAKAYRSSAHEDINLITLLIGASEPGLEVKNRSGLWVPAQTKADEIVVNVGDMLQRLTNHKLKSTTHQVVNPKNPDAMRKSRFSIPFFLHPISNMSLAPLKSCVSSENPARDPDTTAGEYLLERLREIGLT